MADSTPKPLEVFNLLNSKSAEWDKFGREIGVSINDRENLRVDMSRSNDSKLEKVIYIWVESKCSPVTWNHLKEVLEILQWRDIKDKIKAHHSKSSEKEDEVIDGWDRLTGGGRHSLVLGRALKSHDILYCSKISKKYKMFESATHTFRYKCSEGEVITAVVVYDCWSDDTGGDPELKWGGPGYNEVEVKVTPQALRGLHFEFTVYGKKK